MVVKYKVKSLKIKPVLISNYSKLVLNKLDREGLQSARGRRVPS
jgi:hypothetical protein